MQCTAVQCSVVQCSDVQGRDLRGNISLLGVRAPSRGALEAHWGQGAVEVFFRRFRNCLNANTALFRNFNFYSKYLWISSIQPNDIVYAQNKYA